MHLAGILSCFNFILFEYLKRSQSCTFLFKAIPMGTLGFTIATFINSLPRSTDITTKASAD